MRLRLLPVNAVPARDITVVFDDITKTINISPTNIFRVTVVDVFDRVGCTLNFQNMYRNTCRATCSSGEILGLDGPVDAHPGTLYLAFVKNAPNTTVITFTFEGAPVSGLVRVYAGRLKF